MVELNPQGKGLMTGLNSILRESSRSQHLLFRVLGLQFSREVRAPVLQFVRRLKVVHLAFPSILGPVDPAFRALFGRFKFAVRRHKFNKDSFPQEEELYLVEFNLEDAPAILQLHHLRHLRG